MAEYSNHYKHFWLFGAVLLGMALWGMPAAAEGPAPAAGRFMVVTSHPEATKAGYDILSRGGSAADAAVAVQLVLGLVEPQSSGLGGGAVALYYDAGSKTIASIDGLVTAPSTAGRHLFRAENGQPMGLDRATVGGRAVGTPGALRLFEKLHKDHGRLPWRDLFSPAIRLADQGFPAGKRLSGMARADRPRLGRQLDSRLYFFPDGATAVPADYILRNDDYAAILRRVALEGADVFYTGEIAEKIVAAVREDRDNPGLLSIEDLSAYEARERATVCAPYRGYKVCSAGEPTSGGLTLLIALGILSNFDLKALGPDNPQSWHLIAEASRLAFADRNFYMADPDFEDTPGAALLDAGYLKHRAGLIQKDKPIERAGPGKPPGWPKEDQKEGRAPDADIKPPGTAHFSIIDAAGNIASVTSSIENTFGSRLMAEGFLLNSQLTEFAFVAQDGNGVPVANRVEAGKRPRVSMAPVIVFAPDGKPFLVIGSAGGSAIPGYVLERIVGIIDWGMDVQKAVEQDNIINRGAGVEMEQAGKIGPALQKMGHPVEETLLESGLTAILIKSGKMTGAFDPRRDGLAMGN